MAIKIKKKKKKKKTDDKNLHPTQINEPEDILGQGFNISTGTRVLVMGDAEVLRGMYIERPNRPEDKQGLFPMNFSSAAFYMSVIGLLMSGPEADEKIMNENIREATPPKEYDYLIEAGPEGGMRLFGARDDEGMYYLGVGPSIQTARGEEFTFGDLRVVAGALQEAMLAVMPEEDRERALQLAPELRGLAEEEE